MLLEFSRLKATLERYRLDQRRIEAAHMQYAVLNVTSWYNIDTSKLALHDDMDTTLSTVVKDYHGRFMSHYSSE